MNGEGGWGRVSDNRDRKTEPNDFGAITIHPIAHKAIFFLSFLEKELIVILLVN